MVPDRLLVVAREVLRRLEFHFVCKHASAQMTMEEANRAYRPGRIDQALEAFLFHAEQDHPEAQHIRERLALQRDGRHDP